MDICYWMVFNRFIFLNIYFKTTFELACFECCYVCFPPQALVFTQLWPFPLFLRAILKVNRLERAEQAAAEQNLSCGLINTLPASVAKAAATQNRTRETNCGVRVHFRRRKKKNVIKHLWTAMYLWLGKVNYIRLCCAVPRRWPITESHRCY